MGEMSLASLLAVPEVFHALFPLPETRILDEVEAQAGLATRPAAGKVTGCCRHRSARDGGVCAEP